MGNGKNKRPTGLKRPDAVRTKIMRSVKTKNTGPELMVRRWLYSMGYRYRLHVKNLPGTPDIVFRKTKKAIFVNGCFWHGHHCKKGSLPKTNATFWQDKIKNNMARDKKKEGDLHSMGWDVLVLWQCELEDAEKLETILQYFLANQ